ncbi:MAG: 1-deoxy-D-xylulose-5-phosphate reductoisomerase [Acidobacteriota bacterium]|nr:1-deoxy-D-xylulose-5-phosphate reductoisomerase [Acidobacteriota bacterium]
MKRVAVLGSTGSIGTSTLSIVESFPDRFQIVALAAGRNIDLLRSQIARHKPLLVSVDRADDAKTLAREFGHTRFVGGLDGIEEIACFETAHMIVSALVGSIGLAPTVAAIRAGKDIALANKETLVVAGGLVMAEVERAGIKLLPVDSEHAALHQALGTAPIDSVTRLILTASGGPFRTWQPSRIAAANVADALAHPTWKMGPKITIDSATMMNKGLEIIEAHHLFAVPENLIEVVVHPESLIHSIVEFVDGALLAQMAPNDMRFPILHALSWPDRLPSRMPGLDLLAAPPMTFESPDEERFPSLRLAREALRAGGEMPAVLNAANEVAVASFLGGISSLPSIAATVEATLERWSEHNSPLASIEQALTVDREARDVASEELRKYLDTEVGSESRC